MTRTVRPLRRIELDTLLDWAATEGWNPGLADADAFWAADPNGFFGAFVGDTMVAGISAVAYDAKFGFIGLYICHPDWRGQGHGKAVWDAAMDYLGNRTIGLDGVPEQQANYARMGFVPAYRTVRMSGTLPVNTRVESPAMPPPDWLLQLEAAAFPAPRQGFLDHWLRPPHQVLLSAHGGGFGIARPCRYGQKLGPLFARSGEDARNILGQVVGPMQIDVPLAQSAFLDHLSDLGFTAGFHTARMYRGPMPVHDVSLVFGVTTLELG